MNDLEFRIIATEEGGKTSRLFDRLGIDYCFVACSCSKDKFTTENVIYYPCRGEHGSNIAREYALREENAVVFDDDYSSLLYGGMAESSYKAKKYIDKKTIKEVLSRLRDIENENEKVILGGYSAGALHGMDNRFTKNIMQIFFHGKVNKFFRSDSDLYRLNDDVCACIRAYKRGYLCVGCWSIMRAVQTPELVDNTNRYDGKSFAKSFFPILYAPTAAKVGWVSPRILSDGKTRAGRYHHLVSWSKIMPKIVEKND